MPKNVQITIQLYSFYMLARLCSKSFKVGFSSTWIENSQIYKLNLEKAEEPEMKLPTFTESQKKQREFQKNIYRFIDYAKALDCVIHSELWKFLKRWEYQITLPASWKTCMQDKKQQLGLDMGQWTASILGKGYIKAVYCHSAYLISMQSTSCEIPGWMKRKLESRSQGEIS